MSKRKEPADKVTLHNFTLPIYERSDIKAGRTYTGYLFTYTHGGRRVQVRRPTIAEAKEAALEVLRGMSAVRSGGYTLTLPQYSDYTAAAATARRIPGQPSLAQMAADYVAALTHLPAGVALADAVAAYRKTHDRKANLAAMTVEDLRDKFIASRESGGASTRYLEDLRARLTTFSKTFRCQIGSITAAEIAAWLEGLKVSGRTRNNYRGAVVALFAFAKRQGCLPRNEQTEAQLVETAKKKAAKIGIYTPADLRVILAEMPEAMRPALAIGALAGLRSAELFRLDWSEIDLRRKNIMVAADKAKTSQRRLVPILPALADWLRPCAKKTGKIVGNYKTYTLWDRAVRRAFEAMNTLRQEAGEDTVSRVANGLRHSFASYRLAAVKSADQVALEMGNSPRKLFEHYRELVTPAEAGRWFAVRPAAGANIIPYRRTAS